MCTVIVRVPEDAADPMSLLAVRDEDPEREWDPLGTWWPARPDVVGVRDRRAGGAWLAAEPDRGRLAVVLNRAGSPDLPEDQIVSRGMLPFDALVRDAEGHTLAERVAADETDPPASVLADIDRMRGFNLVKIATGIGGEVAAGVTSWTGSRPLATTFLAPGTHMIAHDDVDDPRTARITAWRDAFAAAPFEEWIDVLADTTSVGPHDDRAIIRDNRPHGYPTQSTLACTAQVWPGHADVRYAQLDRAGVWSPLHFA